MRETRAYRNSRTDHEGSGYASVSIIDTARVTRPPFVHFIGLTLRYDYSRGYCVLLPTLVLNTLHTHDDRLT